jgi:hypothetical protein
MPAPVIWPRNAWRTRTFDEIEVLISNWPKHLQLRWWKEESQAYRKLLQRDFARRAAKEKPRPRPHHKLVEAVIARKPSCKYSEFWPLAKQVFDSRAGDFPGVSDVNPERKRLQIAHADGAMKDWPTSKNALNHLLKRTRKRLQK